MDILKKHELFEIDVLESLKSWGLLDALVFGGGTMLRMCYELNRYSVDLDFWFIKKVQPKAYFEKVRRFLEKKYEVTDAQIKYYTILFELRLRDYPKRLKIEIRKETRPCDFQERIAFTKFSTKQVIVRALTLEQMMKNKVAAATDRRQIRDFFDIEFMLRQGIPLTAAAGIKDKLIKAIDSFKENDYKVTLGALLEPETRRYYCENKFTYLLSALRK